MTCSEHIKYCILSVLSIYPLSFTMNPLNDDFSQLTQLALRDGDHPENTMWKLFHHHTFVSDRQLETNDDELNAIIQAFDVDMQQRYNVDDATHYNLHLRKLAVAGIMLCKAMSANASPQVQRHPSEALDYFTRIRKMCIKRSVPLGCTLLMPSATHIGKGLKGLCAYLGDVVSSGTPLIPLCFPSQERVKFNKWDMANNTLVAHLNEHGYGYRSVSILLQRKELWVHIYKLLLDYYEAVKKNPQTLNTLDRFFGWGAAKTVLTRFYTDDAKLRELLQKKLRPYGDYNRTHPPAKNRGMENMEGIPIFPASKAFETWILQPYEMYFGKSAADKSPIISNDPTASEMTSTTVDMTHIIESVTKAMEKTEKTETVKKTKKNKKRRASIQEDADQEEEEEASVESASTAKRRKGVPSVGGKSPKSTAFGNAIHAATASKTLGAMLQVYGDQANETNEEDLFALEDEEDSQEE